jgi:hypothetical protein
VITIDQSAATPRNWRPVVAALANTDLQPVLGRMLLGDSVEDALSGIAPSKKRRLRDALNRSGLITGTEPHEKLNRSVFAELLAQAAEPKQQGVERFLNGERIAQYPANLTEREQLLAWVAERALEPGEVVDEATINGRLERFSPNTALLRRYLVDFALVERTRDGSKYTRPKSPGVKPIQDPGPFAPCRTHLAPFEKRMPQS